MSVFLLYFLGFHVSFMGFFVYAIEAITGGVVMMMEFFKHNEWSFLRYDGMNNGAFLEHFILV